MSASHSGTRPSARLTIAPAPLARIFSFSAFLIALLVAAVFLLARSGPLVEGDSWWHITAGERILATGHWPLVEQDSYTAAGSRWIAYEWLGETAMALAYRLGNLQGVFALLFLLTAALLALTYFYARLRSGDSKAAFVACALLLPLYSVYFTLRPQYLGYILFVATLICLELFHRGRTAFLWLLPLAFLTWANTHPSFVFGFCVLFLHWVSGLLTVRSARVATTAWTPRQRLQLEVCFLLCLVAVCVSPYGTSLAGYPLDAALLQPENLRTNGEYSPIHPTEALGIILAVSVLLFLTAQIFWPVPLRLHEWILFLFSVGAAVLHRRFVLLVVPLFVPLIAVWMARRLPHYRVEKDKPAVNAVMMAAVFAVILTLFPTQAELDQKVSDYYPRDAVAFVRAHAVAGRMFSASSWGGYLTRQLGPAHKVFIDGRGDVFEHTGVLQDYEAIMHATPEALRLLRNYDVRWCILPRESSLAAYLTAAPDWQRVYADGLASVIVKQGVGQVGPDDRPSPTIPQPVPTGNRQ